MSWTTLLATQTDANSPLNQVLLDAIRENLDYLKAYKQSGITVVDENLASGSDPWTVALDSSIDWRDRFIAVSGLVLAKDSGANAQGFLPGGATDGSIASTNASLADDRAWFKGETYYSGDGVSAATSSPLYVAWEVTTAKNVYIWVDATYGILWITCQATTPALDNFVHYLQITYSDDLGGY